MESVSHRLLLSPHAMRGLIKHKHRHVCLPAPVHSAAGLLADTLVSRGMGVTSVRKALQTVAFLVPAGALLLLGRPGIGPATAVGAMTVALGVTSLGQVGEGLCRQLLYSCCTGR